MNISVFWLEMIWRPLICVNNLLNTQLDPAALAFDETLGFMLVA